MCIPPRDLPCPPLGPLPLQDLLVRPGDLRHVRLTLLSALLLLPTPLTSQPVTGHPYLVSSESWGELPSGRNWGAISAIYPGPGGGSIWVADRCGANSCVGREEVDMIFQFDLDGRLLRSFGAGLLAVPHGMHVDREGNVWVVDTAWLGARREGVGHVVRKFSPEGNLLLTLGEWGVPGSDAGHFDRPSDVLVAPDGSIFVADGHDDDGNNRLLKFSPSGDFLLQWGRTGEAAGEFRDPHALAMDSQGRLFVGDRGNHRIQLFDQSGNHLESWTQFGSPSGMYIDADDILYVADSDSNATRNRGWRRGIYIGSVRDGWVRAFIPDPETNADNLVTSGAEGVAVDSRGALYGAEVGPRTLRQYNLLPD